MGHRYQICPVPQFLFQQASPPEAQYEKLHNVFVEVKSKCIFRDDCSYHAIVPFY